MMYEMDGITRRIVDETIADYERERREFELWESRRQQQLPAERAEPAPSTNMGESLLALADEAAIAVAQLENRAGAAMRKLSARLERLERLEEISLLRAENEELRKKAEQLERRVVFVDLSKTHATGDDDVVVDLDAARSAVRGRDVA
jgi:hypothetical protein